MNLHTIYQYNNVDNSIKITESFVYQLPVGENTLCWKHKDIFITLDWDCLFNAIYIDTGLSRRKETVQVTKEGIYTSLKYYKLFSNNAGSASSWYINANTLIAATLQRDGNLRIIIDECCGYKAEHYTGRFEFTNFYSFTLSYLSNRCTSEYYFNKWKCKNMGMINLVVLFIK